MSVKRFDIRSEGPSPRKIAQVADIIHRGGVAAYPTDSVYALGCAIEARDAVERIVKAKAMDPKQRLAIMFPDLSAASEYARFSRAGYRLAKRIFPGPYTFIVKATTQVPRTLLDKKQRTVGVRIPDNPITMALIKQLGRPLLTSTAQAPDQDEPCNDADEVMEHFGKHLDVLIDGGFTSRQPSTVLMLDDDDHQIIVVREGAGPVQGVLDYV